MTADDEPGTALGEDGLSIQQVIDLYSAVYYTLERTTGLRWTEIDLSMAQLRTLHVILRQGEAAIGQVAQALGVRLPTASHLVERLVQAGLVLREEDPLDRRRSLARLSPQAQEYISGLERQAQAFLRDRLGAMQPADRQALAHGLAALLATMQPAGDSLGQALSVAETPPPPSD
jgi:MarR family transcriptional regulator, organic hydroperoxide resistance regulator